MHSLMYSFLPWRANLVLYLRGIMCFYSSLCIYWVSEKNFLTAASTYKNVVDKFYAMIIIKLYYGKIDTVKLSLVYKVLLPILKYVV